MSSPWWVPRAVQRLTTLSPSAIRSSIGTRRQEIYRRKYDAAKTLEAFSAKLKHETDLDAFSYDLVGAVRDTSHQGAMGREPDNGHLARAVAQREGSAYIVLVYAGMVLVASARGFDGSLCAERRIDESRSQVSSWWPVPRSCSGP